MFEKEDAPKNLQSVFDVTLLDEKTPGYELKKSESEGMKKCCLYTFFLVNLKSPIRRLRYFSKLKEGELSLEYFTYKIVIFSFNRVPKVK